MKRAWRWPFAGFVVGALVGATILTVNVVGASSPARPPAGAGSFGEILHTPVLLARAGEPVELRYDVVCGVSQNEPRAACAPKGSVFVRPEGRSTFVEHPLAGEQGGLLSATVPLGEASSGFDYFAEIDNGRGQTARLPAGAGAAPHHVWPLRTWTTVALDEPFRGTRRPDSVAARFAWGKGEHALGLDSGREQSRIGPSAFDVAPDGSIVLLDQVNRQLVVMRGEKRSELPIAFAGGEGDLAVAPDGTIYVLDAGGAAPSVAAFTRAGDLIAETPLAEQSADMVRAGPRGPLVHAYPSEMWLPTGAARPPLSPNEQIAGAQPARSLGNGVGVVVSASPDEARLALVRGDRVLQAWLLRSSTSLGEVQLAEPYGDGLLAVIRLWDEKRAEFRVVRLARDGAAESFSVDRAEWAETASLSRFRLHGDTLYQLRSTASGLEIATFEIGGTS
jgi:hypothetical protein